MLTGAEIDTEVLVILKYWFDRNSGVLDQLEWKCNGLTGVLEYCLLGALMVLQH